MESTCCAVVLHLADEDAEAVLGPPAHAEAQPAVQTFVHRDGVEVLAVIATWEHVTWSGSDVTNRRSSLIFEFCSFVLRWTFCPGFCLSGQWWLANNTFRPDLLHVPGETFSHLVFYFHKKNLYV